MKIRHIVAVALLSLLFPAKSALAQLSFPASATTSYKTGSVDTSSGITPCPVPAAKTCLTLSTPSSIAVGDFNNDGKLDLAVINQVPVKVGSEFKFYLSVLLGNGDGTFSDTPILTETGGGTPCPSNANLATCDRGVVGLAGDFNEDGKDDLVVIYFGNPTGSGGPVTNGKVGLFLSNGDGTFAAPTFTTVGLGAINGAVGQLTSSGHLDVVVVNREDTPNGSISVLLGNGGGGLSVANCDGATTTANTCEVGKKPSAVAIGQFDADGVADLAVTSLTDSKVTLLKGDGVHPGQFAPFPTPTAEVTLQSIQIIADDFNRDGKTDLAVLNQQTKTVSMLFGNGDGTFTELSKKTLLLGKTPVGMVAADFDGDGTLDLAFVFFPGKLAGVFAGRGDGTFSNKPEQLKVPGTSTGNFALAAFNVNRDPAPPDNPPPPCSIVGAECHLAFANGTIVVFENQTPFPTSVTVTVTSPNGGETFAVGSTQTITWDTALVPPDFPFGNAEISLSTDSGATFKTIKTTPNTGTFLWKVPKSLTTTGRIRVCSANYPGLCDMSNADFTIQ
ncbi:MAG TPA: FG-GAP-like repeat-containing protein [Candidatus Binatia bacterium]|nr:FG-GAP-like repeat-containing protein [Candidatus Binatia bacterium]